MRICSLFCRFSSSSPPHFGKIGKRLSWVGQWTCAEAPLQVWRDGWMGCVGMRDLRAARSVGSKSSHSISPQAREFHLSLPSCPCPFSPC